MADLATASGAAMFDAGTAAPVEKKKPEKPDEEAFKQALKKAEKEHADAMVRFNAAKSKVDTALPKGKDSPANKRRQELMTERAEIQKQQAASKGGRNQVMDQIKKLEEQVKSRIAEQKLARGKVAFRSAEDVDREIERLEKQVDSGSMKLVDERKALTEISNLRKQKKGFAGFEQAQAGIDDLKKKIKDLRDGLDDSAAKALSDRYSKITAELDAIKAEQDEAYKNINALRDERTKLHTEQQEKYMAIKKLKDDYYSQKKAFGNWEFEARQKARERARAEREAFEKQKRKERAEKALEEASYPAYSEEIRRAKNLVYFLDPTSAPPSAAPLVAPSKFSAEPQRKVDDSDLKGVKVLRKEDREEDYFKGTGGKKGKKGRKAAKDDSPATTPGTSGRAGGFMCPPSVIEDCGSMGIDPPMVASEVPATLEKVKEKLAFWEKDQEAQTQRNIAKAKKEIEKLDAAETGKPIPEDKTPEAPVSNGDSKATAAVEEGGSVANEIALVKEAVADVAADLAGASIEEKAE